MEIAELILQYLKALTWPIVVVSGILIFRRPITEILGRIRGFKAGSFEMDAKADETSAALDVPSAVTIVSRPEAAPLAEPDERTSDTSSPRNKSTLASSMLLLNWLTADESKSFSQREFESLRQVAVDNPARAVREAFHALRRAFMSYDFGEGSLSESGRILGQSERLARHGVLRPTVPTAVAELEQIFISVSRDGESISTGGALSYIDAVQKLAAVLRSSAVVKAYKSVLLDDVPRRHLIENEVGRALSDAGMTVDLVQFTAHDDGAWMWELSVSLSGHPKDGEANPVRVTNEVIQFALKKYGDIPYNLSLTNFPTDA